MKRFLSGIMLLSVLLTGCGGGGGGSNGGGSTPTGPTVIYTGTMLASDNSSIDTMQLFVDPSGKVTGTDESNNIAAAYNITGTYDDIKGLLSLALTSTTGGTNINIKTSFPLPIAPRGTFVDSTGKQRTLSLTKDSYMQFAGNYKVDLGPSYLKTMVLNIWDDRTVQGVVYPANGKAFSVSGTMQNDGSFNFKSTEDGASDSYYGTGALNDKGQLVLYFEKWSVIFEPTFVTCTKG